MVSTSPSTRAGGLGVRDTLPLCYANAAHFEGPKIVNALLFRRVAVVDLSKCFFTAAEQCVFLGPPAHFSATIFETFRRGCAALKHAGQSFVPMTHL